MPDPFSFLSAIRGARGFRTGVLFLFTEARASHTGDLFFVLGPLFFPYGPLSPSRAGRMGLGYWVAW